ncbi:hypothetical protein V8E55_009521 [Tylopilus felleus]
MTDSDNTDTNASHRPYLRPPRPPPPRHTAFSLAHHVIDTAPPDNNGSLPGLRILHNKLRYNNDQESTNVLYLIIYHMFSSLGKKCAVKVDVITENRSTWIKNSHLIMEFYEIDSYLTSGDDSSWPCLAQTEFDNSMLRMGRELLATAKANSISMLGPSSSLPTTTTPQVTPSDSP